jgi:hypothetical protein
MIHSKQVVTKKDLAKLILTEVKHILLKEDISTNLVQANSQPENGFKGTDEIGEFYMVKHPIEGDTTDNIVSKCSIPHLMTKVKMGEIPVESIHSFYRKDTSANRQAKKVLKEFNNSLQAGRKLQLGELETKRKGWQMRLEGSKHLFTGKVLDEETSVKFKQIEEHIAKLDNNIAELQKKINGHK